MRQWETVIAATVLAVAGLAIFELRHPWLIDRIISWCPFCAVARGGPNLAPGDRPLRHYFGTLTAGTQVFPLIWERVERAKIGDADWPVEGADEVLVGCADGRQGVSAFVVVNGVGWALNGLTKGWPERPSYRLRIGEREMPVLAPPAGTDWPWWRRARRWVPDGPLTPIPDQALFAVADRLGCLDPRNSGKSSSRR